MEIGTNLKNYEMTCEKNDNRKLSMSFLGSTTLMPLTGP